MAVIETPLTRLLNIRHPILLAPMASAAGGRLAAAVTHAGGLGMIGSGYADGRVIEAEAPKAGNARFGIGFITWALDQRRDALDLALRFKPAAVMLSFGDPSPYAQEIQGAGALLFCQVQSLRQAEEALACGADVIIAQGRDAGGHSGDLRGTMALVPSVVDIAGTTPVVAAGGVADGRGLAAVLSLGASGALLGTRFAATQESLWTEKRKRALVDASGDDTRQTRVFDIIRRAAWPEIYPGRALRNAFFDTWGALESKLKADLAPHEGAFLKADVDDLDVHPVWAGESVDLVRDCPPAEAVVETLISGAVATLRASVSFISDKDV